MPIQNPGGLGLDILENATVFKVKRRSLSKQGILSGMRVVRHSLGWNPAHIYNTDATPCDLQIEVEGQRTLSREDVVAHIQQGRHGGRHELSFVLTEHVLVLYAYIALVTDCNTQWLAMQAQIQLLAQKHTILVS